MREKRTLHDDGERGPRMAKGLQGGRHLKGEAGPTNRERSAKQMQSGDPGPGSDFAIEDSTWRSRYRLKVSTCRNREWGRQEERETVKGLAKPNGQTGWLPLLFAVRSHGVRQRPFARPYVTIILSKGLRHAGPCRPIIAFFTKCHWGE